MAQRKETARRKTRGSGNGEAAPQVTDAQVMVYLLDHPKFLLDHSELLRALTPPTQRTGDKIVDMQVFMINRLRADHKNLIAASRNTMAELSRVHEAALALLGADSFETLVHIVTTDLVMLLDLDTVVLGVECTADDAEKAGAVGICALKPGTVNRLVGRGRDIKIRGSARGVSEVFAGVTDLVRSHALIRLNLGKKEPAGVLALGSRAEDRFQSGQGTERLVFLARILEHCVHGWLDLPG